MMLPYENISYYNFQGAYSGSAEGDIGCGPGCPAGWQWYPPSSEYANSNGTFYDIPFSVCSRAAFGSFLALTQDIYVIIGSEGFEVRSQSLYASSTSSGHGTLTNNSDIDETQ